MTIEITEATLGRYIIGWQRMWVVKGLRFGFSITFMDRRHVISSFQARINDIEAEDLKKPISLLLKKQYLSALKSGEPQIEQQRSGIIYGKSRRGIIAIPTRFSTNRPIWIHYVICTGSPSTFLAKTAIQSLRSLGQSLKEPIQVAINGVKITVDESTHHFEDVNILGMDYLIGRKSLMYCLAGREQSTRFDLVF